VEARPGVLYVQMGYVVANMDGVATQLCTVELVVRASVLVEEPLQPHLLLLLVVMLAASSARLFLRNCLNIGTIKDVVMDSTLTMLSSLLPNLSMALAQLVMILHVKGSLRLSWLKPLMRPQVSFKVFFFFFFGGVNTLIFQQTKFNMCVLWSNQYVLFFLFFLFFLNFIKNKSIDFCILIIIFFLEFFLI
jgi:hypothetical protein